MWHRAFYIISAIVCLCILSLSLIWSSALYLFLVVVPLLILGFFDIQSKNNVLYNYPVIGHLRYLMEFLSPEIRQYFLEDDKSGSPYNRQQRHLVTSRGHGESGIHPFGTEYDIKAEGYDFTLHSIAVKEVEPTSARVMIGGSACKRPYYSSRFNISAMSFGALSSNAVLAMNKGAALGGFSQDTGEGGLTSYHLKYKGDLIWEIASGYFGCRTPEGRFDDEQFRKKAANDSVKMIAIKLSQGAKPSHGGVLPAAKVSAEIAEFRGVPMGVDCVSPAVHPEFNTPIGLLQFVARLRELSGGKPIGFKLCIGRRSDFLSICKAMLTTAIRPDFITIDGAEGGTGAGPVELTDYFGLAIDEALPFVHASLVGCGLRDEIRLFASGKIVNAFDIIKKIAIGADACNVARPMMFAVGCIQALRCHTGNCPTGVTTQDPKRSAAIDVDVKAVRVKNYHEKTLESFLQLMGALGIEHPDQLTPDMIWHRLSSQKAVTYAQLYDYLEPGALLGENIPAHFSEDWQQANADHYYSPGMKL